jgi:hypothetical protein
MIFYHYRPHADRYRCVHLNDADFARTLTIHRTDAPVLATWVAPVVTEFEEDAQRPIGDFPTFNSFWTIPVVSQRAWDSLASLLGTRCEALPIVHPSGRPFYILHSLNTVDALDEKQSELSRNDVTGRVSAVYRYSLREELLKDHHLFKLPLENGGETLVSHTFREVIERHKLRGLTFTPIPMANESSSE